jgi:hypothetical protein
VRALLTRQETTGYSSTPCSPTETASASPAGQHLEGLSKPCQPLARTEADRFSNGKEGFPILGRKSLTLWGLQTRGSTEIWCIYLDPPTEINPQILRTRKGTSTKLDRKKPCSKLLVQESAVSSYFAASKPSTASREKFRMVQLSGTPPHPKPRRPRRFPPSLKEEGKGLPYWHEF